MKDFQDARPTDLPDGYEMRPDGIYLLPEVDLDDDEEGAPIWLCSRIEVTAVTKDVDSERHGRLLVAMDAFGKVHEWVMSAADLDRPAKIATEMLNRGLRIAPETALRKAVSKLLLNWCPAETVLLSDKHGWVDGTCQNFLLGDGTSIGPSRSIYAPRSAKFSPATVTKCGTLDLWQQSVSLPAVGNPVLVVAISLAFAGPLLRLLGLEGFGLHLKGKSSTGKTTASVVATSVWGGVELKHTWRTTSNGLEGTAASADDTLLSLDELGEVSAKDADAAAYMLANGQGKGRSTAHGSSLATSKWKVVFLSTGEISLAEKLAEAHISRMDGQAVRCMDISIDGRTFGIFDNLHGEARAADFANLMTQASKENNGTAGRAFVEKLIRKRSMIIHSWPGFLKKFKLVAQKKVGGPQDAVEERVAAQFALIALAGELATRFELTGWTPLTAHSAAIELFQLWKQGRVNPLSNPEILRRIKDYVDANMSRLQVIGEAPVRDPVGWMNNRWIMFSDGAWEDMHDGLKPVSVAKSARAHGLLVITDGNNLKAKAPFGVPGRPRLYSVNRSVFEKS